MLTSARNRFRGRVTAIHGGAGNDEVEIKLPGGDTLAAIMICESVESPGLPAGSPVVAFFKASHVIVGVTV